MAAADPNPADEPAEQPTYASGRPKRRVQQQPRSFAPDDGSDEEQQELEQPEDEPEGAEGGDAEPDQGDQAELQPKAAAGSSHKDSLVSQRLSQCTLAGSDTITTDQARRCWPRVPACRPAAVWILLLCRRTGCLG